MGFAFIMSSGMSGELGTIPIGRQSRPWVLDDYFWAYATDRDTV